MYLPGRALRCALRWNPIGHAVAIAVDIALSLSCVVLAGIGLNSLGFGIRFSSMLALLVGASVVLPLTTFFRRQREREASAASDVRRFAGVAALPLTVFLILALVAVGIATRSAESAANRVKTTELSIVESHPDVATVTVSNQEHARETYRLIVSLPSRVLTYHVQLGQGAAYSLSIPTLSIGDGRRVTASLYMGIASSPSRRVWLTSTAIRAQLTQ
jgi:uncharacterized membrane protein